MDDDARHVAGSDTTDLEVWRLLPWLANDTLEGREMERVLEHLKHSRECRRELLFLSELRHAVEVASDDRLEPSPARLERLMKRIDRHESDRHGHVASVGDAALPRTETARRGMPRWLLVAQAALLALLVGALAWTLAPSDAEPAFRTLSADDSAVGARAPGARLRLIFEDRVAERDLRRLLLDAGAEIVAGPTALGVYTVEFTGELPASDADATFGDWLELLRGDPRVAFAEPVPGTEPP